MAEYQSKLVTGRERGAVFQFTIGAEFLNDGRIDIMSNGRPGYHLCENGPGRNRLRRVSRTTNLLYLKPFRVGEGRLT